MGRRLRAAGFGLALIFLSGCDGEEHSTELIAGIHGPTSTVAALDVETHIAVGGWSRTIQGEGRTTLPVGPLSLQVVATEDGEVVASFALEDESQADWRYYLDLYVDQGDPREFAWTDCSPTVRSAAVQHRPPGLVADSLYLTWLGLPALAMC